MSEVSLAPRIAELVAEASEGTVSGDHLRRDGARLVDLGLSSLAYLRLIDAIENEYGVYIDLEKAEGKLGTVQQIAEYVAAEGGVHAG